MYFSCMEISEGPEHKEMISWRDDFDDLTTRKSLIARCAGLISPGFLDHVSHSHSAGSYLMLESTGK